MPNKTNTTTRSNTSTTNMQVNEDLRSIVARHDADILTLVDGQKAIVAKLESFSHDIFGRLDQMEARRAEEAKPKLSLMMQFAGIALVAIGLCSGAIFFYFNENIKRLDTKTETSTLALDNKLQKETALAAEGIREKATAQQKQLDDLDKRLQLEFQAATTATNAASSALQAQIDRRITDVKNWQEDRMKRDLDELKERRLNDSRRLAAKPKEDGQ